MVMLFEKKIAFFGSLDELKMHQLCKLITIRMSKYMLSISCKGATNCQSFCIANSMHQTLPLRFKSQQYLRLRSEKRKFEL